MKDRIPMQNGKNNIIKAKPIPENTSLVQLIQMLNSGLYADVMPNNATSGDNAGVSEVGTPNNKANLFSDATAALYGLSGDNANVDAALKRAVVDFSSYNAFCANTNVNSLDAAFGKNNESEFHGIGKQLAMYAWFKGDSKTTYPFNELSKADKYADVLSIPLAKTELQSNVNLVDLVISSPFARGLQVEKLTSLTNTNGCYAIIHDGTKFILANSGGTGKIQTTTDFVNFTSAVTIGARAIIDLAYKNGVYLAQMANADGVTAAVHRSTDLQTWTQVIASIPSDTSPQNQIIVANNKFYLVASRSGPTNVLKFSSDGITWTDATISGSMSADMLGSIAYNGSKFVVTFYGNTTKILVSTDGITFTVTTATGFTNTSYAPTIVAGDDNKFYLINNKLSVFVSTDGVNYAPIGTITGTLTDFPTRTIFAYPLVLTVGYNGYVSMNSKNGNGFTQLVGTDGIFGFRAKIFAKDGFGYIAFGGYIYRIKLPLV